MSLETPDLQMLAAAARSLRQGSTESKNNLLQKLAVSLLAHSEIVLKANEEDLNALSVETAPSFRDRLTLNEQRLQGMAESLRVLAKLPDPVGEVVEDRQLENGLRLRRVRATLGVIFMIFESRPNVIFEAFSLAFKSGNVIILRGGSESRQTSKVLYSIVHQCLRAEGFAKIPFYGVEDYDRGLVTKLLKRKDYIDVVVPRGGEKLIEYVQETALMPIIKNDRGLCHCYVDEDADLEMAIKIIVNAKAQRPGVCNALETTLVHEKIASDFLPRLHRAFAESTAGKNLVWYADEATESIFQKNLYKHKFIESATAESWATEYLDLMMNCRVVDGLEQALAHIAQYGSKHSETIVTSSEVKARHFQAEVDAAAVYWNASTRFTDGFEFGLGGELGISTQKLHVRGPVGLRELTTPRWIIDGTGQVRA